MREGSIVKAIAHQMQTGVLVLDRSGRIIYFNPFFGRLFSPDSKIKGKTIGSLSSKSGILKAVEGFIGDKGHGAGDVEISEKDRFFKVSMAPLEDAAIMLFLQDVTEEKRVEAIKKDFVANVSHELRTPLASIKGYAETLLDGGLHDKKTLKEFLTVIDRHASRMSRLIDDLLVLSRLESHQMPMVYEPVDMRELARAIAEGFKKQAKDKGLKMSMNFGDSLPKVLGDRVRIEQVMVNLLDNAIKYTPSGGKVEMIISAKRREVRVDVKDTGIGIPSSDMPRIFERFYRVDKARSRDLGGTGLGLAIVKHIIQGLNGKVLVESAPGKGSIFSFTLKTAA